MKKIISDQRGIAGILEIALIAVVLAVVGFVGYRAYQQKQSKSGSSKQPTTTATTTPTLVDCGTVDLSQSSGSFDVSANTSGESSSRSSLKFEGPNAAKFEASAKCFDQKFTKCEKATYTAYFGDPNNNETNLGSYYETKGAKSNGCQVTFKYPKNPNPEWANKDLTCTFDNKKSLEEAVKDVFDAISGNKPNDCEGPLVALLKG